VTVSELDAHFSVKNDKDFIRIALYPVSAIEGVALAG
jgi:hypothetical protein